MTLLIIDVRMPSSAAINSTRDFWLALRHIAPSIFAFVLSFTVILITWFNHHAAFKLVNRSSASFVYANGLLLLTVVALPFTTSLLGEYLLTDHAAPAVVIYDGVAAVQAVGWILVSGAALRNQLTRNDKSTVAMRENRRSGYFACALYSGLALIAFWFPLTVAVVTALLWAFWLIYGIRIRSE